MKAPRESRGVALLYLTSALEGGDEGSASRPDVTGYSSHYFESLALILLTVNLILSLIVSCHFSYIFKTFITSKIIYSVIYDRL
jgi:hypothetical protein